MSEQFNQVRRCGMFELVIASAGEHQQVCEVCGRPSIYQLKIGQRTQFICADCLKNLKTCLSDEEEYFDGEKKIRWQTLKSWRKHFHEKVSTQSYYSEFPTKLIVETIQDLGCEILDESGNPTSPETNGVGSGSHVYRLGYNGHVVGNSVLVINWYDEKVHGIKGKVELNAYIS